jgi:hypothetical protein
MVNPISIPLITAVIQQEGVSTRWQMGDRPLHGLSAGLEECLVSYFSRLCLRRNDDFGDFRWQWFTFNQGFMLPVRRKHILLLYDGKRFWDG